MSRGEFKEAIDRAWGKRNIVCPDPGVPFVLQHRDLIPSDIFVTIPEDPEEDAEVTTIIDWQSLAYYRKWEVARPQEDYGALVCIIRKMETIGSGCSRMRSTTKVSHWSWIS